MCGGGIVSPTVHYDVKVNCDYGILSGKGLDFNLGKREIIFPTGGWHIGMSVVSGFRAKPDFSGGSVKKVRGRIKCGAVDLPHLYDGGISGYFGITKTSEVLVGSGVSDYFARAAGGAACYDDVKKLLV